MSATAFDFLCTWALGRLCEILQALGMGRFIDGAGPGNGHRGVHVRDDVSLSVLQVRLNDLQTGKGMRHVECALGH